MNTDDVVGAAAARLPQRAADALESTGAYRGAVQMQLFAAPSEAPAAAMNAPRDTDGADAVAAWKHALGMRPGDVLIPEIQGPGGVIHRIVVAGGHWHPEGHRSSDGVWRWAEVPAVLDPPGILDGQEIRDLTIRVLPNPDGGVTLLSGERVLLDPEQRTVLVRPFAFDPVRGSQEPLTRPTPVLRPPLNPNARPHPTVGAAGEYVDLLNRKYAGEGFTRKVDHRAVGLVDALLSGDVDDAVERGITSPGMQTSRDWFARRVGLPAGLKGDAFVDAWLGALGRSAEEWRAEEARKDAEAQAAREAKEQARREEARLRKWGPALVAWHDDPDKGYNVTPRMLASFRNKQWSHGGKTYYPDGLVAAYIREGRTFVESPTSWNKRTHEIVDKPEFRAMTADGGAFAVLSKSDYLFGRWLQDHPEYMDAF